MKNKKYWNNLTQAEMNKIIKIVKYNPKINYKKLDELYSKSKKGYKIIEANKLYKELKGFIQWIGFFMIIRGLYLLGQGLWLKFTI
jgi:hypothetical protein